MSFGKENKRKIHGIISIASLSIALFLVSAEFTGNVISEFGEGGLRNFSICFFLCGLIFAFFYLNAKKQL